ncbi:Helix-turn-helix domain protein [compost metagenome]
MVLAQQKLKEGRTVAAVAAAVGYNSQSAFAHAFKRTLGRVDTYLIHSTIAAIVTTAR